MRIQAYSSMVEQISAARQRWLGQSGNAAASGFAALVASFQPEQGTIGSANAAAPANTAAGGASQPAGTSPTATVPGQSPVGITQADQPHRHHHHHGSAMTTLLGSSSTGAVMGSQDSGGVDTDETVTSGLFASVDAAVKQAISAYRNGHAAASGSTPANALMS